MVSSLQDRVPKPIKDVARAFTEAVKSTDLQSVVPGHETDSEAHQMWRSHANHSGNSSEPHPVPGVQSAQATGVIYVTNRAQAQGFGPGVKGWANCGQGAPETGDIPGSSPKPTSLDFTTYGDDIHEYAPTAGLKPLRDAIADYYNREFRQEKELKYGAENVCVVPGGRGGLSRIAAVLGDINLGFSVPVYSAYEQMLSAFSRFVPIPTQTEADRKYKLTATEVRKEIVNRGLSAFLLSNPNNPTGHQIHGQELADLVKVARDTECSIILDEFYSWYQHTGELGKAVSAARYVEDPNEDPIILIDGLTKNWRCPGWRVCWVVGPSELVSALSSAGSFLDGGASHPMQCLAIEMLKSERVEVDRLALQRHFRMKREHVLNRLEKMGLPIACPPDSTFYIWIDLKPLPAPINSGMVFAEEAIKEKVIVVPGIFFDVNPGRRRNILNSPCESFIRFSFGPPLDELNLGLDGFERLIGKARRGEGGLGRGYQKGSHSHHSVGSIGASGS